MKRTLSFNPTVSSAVNLFLTNKTIVDGLGLGTINYDPYTFREIIEVYPENQ